MPATPPSMRDGVQPLAVEAAVDLHLARAGSAARVASDAGRPWTALTPSQLRALCARRPGTVSTARSVPWQPASISPSVRLHQDREVAVEPAALLPGHPAEPVLRGLDLLVVVEDEREVVGGPAPGTPKRPASRSITASPDFMSLVPQPYSRCTPSTIRGRRAGCRRSGTVSRCPASTTRLARSEVRPGQHRVADPLHLEPAESRAARSRRRRPGLLVPDTDGASTRARVRVRTSAERSRSAGVRHARGRSRLPSLGQRTVAPRPALGSVLP